MVLLRHVVLLRRAREALLSLRANQAEGVAEARPDRHSGHRRVRSGPDALYTDDSILEAGCNAHAPGRYREAHDAEPEWVVPSWALLALQRLFAVEREANDRGLDSRTGPARGAKIGAHSKALYGWLKSKLTPSTEGRRRPQSQGLHARAP